MLRVKVRESNPVFVVPWIIDLCWISDIRTRIYWAQQPTMTILRLSVAYLCINGQQPQKLFTAKSRLFDFNPTRIARYQFVANRSNERNALSSEGRLRLRRGWGMNRQVSAGHSTDARYAIISTLIDGPLVWVWVTRCFPRVSLKLAFGSMESSIQVQKISYCCAYKDST